MLWIDEREFIDRFEIGQEIDRRFGGRVGLFVRTYPHVLSTREAAGEIVWRAGALGLMSAKSRRRLRKARHTMLQ